MRGTTFAMALAMTIALAFTAPVQAANYSYGGQQNCVVKTVKTYGAYGRVVIKKMRICK
ncbi:MAG TPA: hypothetical protein VGO04_30785 [Ensifer sp.]|jgi:hypothetical protein|uniref:hypothetical protein n=1 Tax=Ensifer sp. TaxID=1872086 RepID=UPI002E101E77|nr:hypothetical protein [Ensifer sp.]